MTNELRELGVEAGDEAGVESILASIRTALAETPDDPSLHVAQGVAYERLGRLEAAGIAFRRALALTPDDVATRFRSALVLERLGEPEGAMDTLKVILEADAGHTAARSSLGLMLRRHGRLEEAVEVHRASVRLDPHNAVEHHNLAAALHAAGHVEEAITHFRAAAASAPDHVAMNRALGIALRDAGRLDEAEAIFRDALARRDEDATAAVDLATVLLARDATDDALPLLIAASDAAPNAPDVLVWLGDAFLRIDRMEDAATAYRRALSLAPGNDRILHRLDHVLLELGALDALILLLEDCVRRDPDDAIAPYLLAAASNQDVDAATTRAYVRAHFDELAVSFDEVQRGLRDRVPETIAEGLASERPGRHLDVLDLGCGTGRGGLPLRAIARRLDGVDLSPAMLRQATRRRIYDALVEADLTEYLAGLDRAYGAIVIADTFAHFGDLTGVLSTVRRHLEPEGLTFFTVEPDDDEGDGFRLDHDGRYRHSIRHVLAALENAGLRAQRQTPCDLQRPCARAVPGRLITACPRNAVIT